LRQDPPINERTHRRHRLVHALTRAGNAIDKSRNLLADTYKATQGAEQQDGEESDGAESQGMSHRKKDNAYDKSENFQPHGHTRLDCHLHRVQRLPRLHRILVSGRGPSVKFDCFGNLTKALTFSAERAARVAECRVSEHVGLIHAFDVGHDLWPQQQSTLFDQLGHFREAQLGFAEDLRGAVLGGIGHGRILRVHLLHGLLQGCHVIDHRKTSPATIGRLIIGNCAGKLLL
jgi:hypothetical protein